MSGENERAKFLYGDKEPFRGIDWGKGQMRVDATGYDRAIKMLPREVHHKADGSIKDEPSFSFVFTSPEEKFLVSGEISMEMLNKGLGEIGYEIVKRDVSK